MKFNLRDEETKDLLLLIIIIIIIERRVLEIGIRDPKISEQDRDGEREMRGEIGGRR